DRDRATALRRSPQGVAGTVPRASRGCRAVLRSMFSPHVGVLPRCLGNVVPPFGAYGFPDPAGETRGDGADHPRLHRSRRGAVARARGWCPTTAQAGRPVAAPSPIDLVGPVRLVSRQRSFGACSLPSLPTILSMRI